MSRDEARLSRDAYYEAQCGVLGSMLIDERTAGMVMHRTGAEDYTGVCRTIFLACRTLFQAGRPIDPVTVRNEIGAEYSETLVQLMEITPTAANVEEYIDLTLEQSALARGRELGSSLTQAASLDELRELTAKLNRIAAGHSTARVVSMEQGYLDFCDRQKHPARLIEWGMSKIDSTLRVEYGDFIVLGGYPSAGKTAFSLQLAWNQAKVRRVGYFSLETKPEKLIDRAVAAVCGVDFGRIKGHSMTEADWEQCATRAQSFVGRNLELIQAGGLSVVDIQALALAGRYEVIYIDYLQLVAPEDRRRSDVEQISQISRDLHTMAQTTGITVCALSQLSRPDKSGEQERAPGLHSLRQSGQIEQDADGVMLLYKAVPKLLDSSRVLKIAKNKEGQAGGVVRLLLDGPHQRFRAVEAHIADAHDRQQAQIGRRGAADPEPAPPPERMVQGTLYELPEDEAVPWEDAANRKETT